MNSNNIDYYFELEKEENIGDTLVTCFRTQMFVTRSTVVLVEVIQKNSPKIIGMYTSLE